MFRGANAITMDDKGRIAIPARYREMLQEDCGGEIVCTIDINQPCILLYPMPEWEVMEDKLRKLSDMNPRERKMKRILLHYMSEAEIDKNGRFMLSSMLREKRELGKQLMLVGQLNRFEIWDKAVWQQQMDEDMDTILNDDSPVSERLQSFSF